MKQSHPLPMFLFHLRPCCRRTDLSRQMSLSMAWESHTCTNAQWDRYVFDDVNLLLFNRMIFRHFVAPSVRLPLPLNDIGWRAGQVILIGKLWIFCRFYYYYWHAPVPMALAAAEAAASMNERPKLLNCRIINDPCMHCRVIHLHKPVQRMCAITECAHCTDQRSMSSNINDSVSDGYCRGGIATNGGWELISL